jgi:hypothetical protein
MIGWQKLLGLLDVEVRPSKRGQGGPRIARQPEPNPDDSEPPPLLDESDRREIERRRAKKGGGVKNVAWNDLYCCPASELMATVDDREVDLVFTSPPYEDCRTYETGMVGGGKFQLKGQGWVDWLAPIIAECARVSNGLVCVNMSSPVRQFQYTAAVEWLVSDLTRKHGLVCGPSPYAWTKSAGIPGSGGPHYHRRDWEPVYCFALPDRLPLAWSDPLAFGQPPKCAPGGDFSARQKDGRRVGARFHGKRKADGSVRKKWYEPPDIANPGNVILANVGGGHLGAKAAHRGEAPMPLALAERFVCWYCPEGGTVFDPFMGTGTTLVAAATHRRNGLGCDVRQNQVEITRNRLRETTPSMV